ncbi:MAG: AGE family epimerase/isomerase [Oscillospiraceae bacterium]
MLSKMTRDNYENCILPFWKNLVDDEYGGFYGYVDFNLEVDKLAPKGVILNSRILWFFSNAYLCYADDEALSYAKHAYRFLREHCMDRENGGVYWMLKADGSPMENIKHTYNQAFAIYALSSYYDATGDHEALETAFEIFQLVEDVCTDDIGYLEAFSVDFNPIDNEELSENGLLADRTMNTLLHLLEAYTELYRVSGDENVENRLRFILKQFQTKVFNPEKKLLEVFFDYNMNSIADMQSFGHDIEASWLLDRAAEVLEDSNLLRETREYTGILAETVYQRAYKNHSLLNEQFAGNVDTTRVWWVQAEAVVGFLNAYKYTSDEKYLAAAQDIWEYISQNMVDKRPGGEWFWELNENGIPASKKPIVEPWKCPYHNGRLCFEVTKRGF